MCLMASARSQMIQYITVATGSYDCSKSSSCSRDGFSKTTYTLSLGAWRSKCFHSTICGRSKSFISFWMRMAPRVLAHFDLISSISWLSPVCSRSRSKHAENGEVSLQPSLLQLEAFDLLAVSLLTAAKRETSAKAWNCVKVSVHLLYML